VSWQRSACWRRTGAVARLRCVEGIDSLKGIRTDCELKMDKTIESLRNNLAAIRTGRASSSLLNRIQVKYYGVDTPLLQLAGVTTPSSTVIQIEPYDKSCMPEIERAIAESELGLTPANDGNVIRLNIPPLTEERRKQLVKTAREMAEESRIALRNIRRTGVDAVKKLEKTSDISKDLSADAQEELTKLIKRYETKVDDIIKAKEKEIMTV
jgi:ribosome recycling factor